MQKVRGIKRVLMGCMAMMLLFGGCDCRQKTYPKLASLPKRDRFEYTLESSAHYSNVVQEATLTVSFVSPSRGNFKISGFWDGGKTWRVRFSPTQEGKWTFSTTCSDASNKGLHQMKGEFTRGAPAGNDRFSKHGPVRVSPDGRYLMHEDSTPFLFLADTAWNGALSRPSLIPDGYVRPLLDLAYAHEGGSAVNAIRIPSREPRT